MLWLACLAYCCCLHGSIPAGESDAKLGVKAKGVMMSAKADALPKPTEVMCWFHTRVERARGEPVGNP